MEYLTIFFGALLVGYSGALPPGSLLTVVISQSAWRGWKAGPLLITGHALLELVLVFGIILGLNRFFVIKAVSGWIGIIGGLFLLWMAIGILRDAPRLSLNDKTETEVAAAKSDSPGSGEHGFDWNSETGLMMTGAFASLANPYWSLWWAVGGTALVMKAAQHGPLGFAIFYFGHILADYSWYTLVAAAVAGGRRLMSDVLYRAILVTCGVALVVMAGSFVIGGVRVFLR